MMKRTAIGLAATTCVLFLAVGAFVHAQTAASGWPDPLGWPEYGGSVRRTGQSPLAGPTTNARLFTPTALKAPSFSAPVADTTGHIYVADDSGAITKLRPDLTIAWQATNLGGSARSSVALGPDGTVYIGLVDGPFVALDGSTGALRWKEPPKDDPEDGYVITAAPAVHPLGFVIQPSMDGSVYAYNFTGGLRWKFDGRKNVPDNKIVAAPAVGSDGTIYVGSQNSYLYALTPTGSKKWEYRTSELTAPGFQEEQQVASPSLASDGSIYVTTRLRNSVGLGMVYALKDDGDRATKKWSHQLNDRVTAPVTVAADGSLYIGDVGGSFYKLNPQSGAEMWDFNPVSDDPGVLDDIRENPGDSSTLSVAELAIADAAGRVYVGYWNVDFSQGFPPQGSYRSPMYALKQFDGSIVWRDILPKTARSPLLAPSDKTLDGKTAGILYWSGDDGKMYAHGRGRPATAPTSSPVPTGTTPPLTTSPTPTTPTPPSDNGTPGAGTVFVLAAALVAIALRYRRP